MLPNKPTQRAGPRPATDRQGGGKNMALNDIERRRIEKAVGAFVEKLRPAPHLRPELDFGISRIRSERRTVVLASRRKVPRPFGAQSILYGGKVIDIVNQKRRACGRHSMAMRTFGFWKGEFGITLLVLPNRCRLLSRELLVASTLMYPLATHL